jgi:hypothetical protein
MIGAEIRGGARSKEVRLRTMRLLTVLLLTVCTTTAGGQEFNRAIIDSFDLPLNRPGGVEWVQDLGVMFMADEDDAIIYSVTAEGVATPIFDVNVAIGTEPGTAAANDVCYVEGSARREASIFVCDYGGPAQFPYHDMVYELTTDGTLLNTWDVNSQCGSGGLSGLTFDGSSFWLNCGYNIVKCDTNFVLLDSFVNPSSHTPWQGPMDYDPTYDVLYLMQYHPGVIYVLDPSDHSTVDTLTVHTDDAMGLSLGRPTGSRLRSLWYTDRTTVRLYEIDDHYDTPVNDASWGTIKAIYR